jgi:hypothetical protein
VAAKPKALTSEVQRRKNKLTTDDPSHAYERSKINPDHASAIGEWSKSGYYNVRAAQFQEAQEAGIKLSRYEQAQVDSLRGRSADVIHNRTIEAKRLEDWLTEAPVFKGEPIYRGVAFDNEKAFQETLVKMNRGEKSLALESWTPSRYIAGSFAKERKDMPAWKSVVFELEDNQFGAPLGNLSSIQENEILMPRGVRYEVVGIQDNPPDQKIGRVVRLRQLPAGLAE